MRLNLTMTKRVSKGLSPQDEDSSLIDDEKREKRKIGFGFWVSIGWMILVVIRLSLTAYPRIDNGIKNVNNEVDCYER